MTEEDVREKMAVHGKSLFDRRYTCGGSGNMSARLPDGVLVTPTNCCLGRLEKGRISKLDGEGKLISRDPPSKEWVLLRNENYAVLNHDAVEELRKRFG